MEKDLWCVNVDMDWEKSALHIESINSHNHCDIFILLRLNNV